MAAVDPIEEDMVKSYGQTVLEKKNYGQTHLSLVDMAKRWVEDKWHTARWGIHLISSQVLVARTELGTFEWQPWNYQVRWWCGSISPTKINPEKAYIDAQN